MALEPDAIDLDGLPRTIGGGLKREPVEELLKRVQWEYSQLYYEHRRLKDELDGRTNRGEAAPQKALDAATAERPPVAVAKPGEGVESDDGPVARIQRALQAPSPEPAAASPAPVTTPLPVHAELDNRAPRKDLDELARLVLTSTLRTSLELRESARRDCELMLKKVRTRVAEVEHDLELTKKRKSGELAELDAMLRELRAQMQATLEVLVPEPTGPTPEIGVVELPAPDPPDSVGSFQPAEGSLDGECERLQTRGASELEAAS